MNDDEFGELLRSAERSTPMPEHVRDSIEEQLMVESMTEAQPPYGAAIDRQPVIEQPGRRNRASSILMRVAAAAALIAVGVASWVVVGGEDEEPASETIAVTEPRTLLEACVDFQQSTTTDGLAWHEAIELSALDTAVFARWADALDELIQVTNVGRSGNDLARAAEILRTDPVDLAAFVEAMDAARLALSQDRGPTCLDQRPLS